MRRGRPRIGDKPMGQPARERRDGEIGRHNPGRHRGERASSLCPCTLFLTGKSSRKSAGRKGAQMLSYRTTFQLIGGLSGGALRNSIPGRAGDSFDRTACLAGSLSPLGPQAGKIRSVRSRRSSLITVWLEVRVLPAPPRTPIRTGVSWSLTNSAHFGPELAGLVLPLGL